MKYYRIYASADSKVTGTYPQVLSANYHVDIWDPRNIGNIFFEKTDGHSFVPTAKLERKAKKTDLLSCIPAGLTEKLVVSQLLADVIKVSNYYGVEFYDITIQTIEEDLPYVLVHPYSANELAYNFQESKIVRKRRGENSGEKLTIRTFEELVNIGMATPFGTTVTIESLELNPTPDDFFVMRRVVNGGLGWYVSERLKEAIEREACSGIIFKDINEPHP